MTHSLPIPCSPDDGGDKDEDLICPVCQEEFKDPKFLPCHHYYCKDCIQQLVTRAGPRTPISCPECRTQTEVPNDDVSQLLPAFFVNKLLDKRKREKPKMMSSLPAPTVSSAVCALHSGILDHFCTQCKAPICLDCTLTVHKHHACYSLETLTGSHPSLFAEQRKGKCSYSVLY